MISNEKVVNNTVVELIETYNFGLSHFFIRIRLGSLKFEFQNLINLNRLFDIVK
jgi:hypothetical protein